MFDVWLSWSAIILTDQDSCRRRAPGPRLAGRAAEAGGGVGAELGRRGLGGGESRAAAAGAAGPGPGPPQVTAVATRIII